MEQTKDKKGIKFIAVILLNLTITIVEVIGGIVSGSLGLLSDAFHNLQDSFSIVISYVAYLIGKKKSDSKNTFGYKRAEIIGAFVNSIALLVICIFLIIEGVSRFIHPTKINSDVMINVAIIGLLGNLISMLIFRSDAKNNLNVKATFLHMLSDTMSSVGVVVAALFIKYLHWYWVDPLITILVALWIIKEAVDVIKETSKILMESNPDIDLEEVKKTILQVPEVVNVHHAHIWMMDEKTILFDAHINVSKNETVEQLEIIYEKIDKSLKDEYGINHVTVQAECQKGINEPLIGEKNT